MEVGVTEHLPPGASLGDQARVFLGGLATRAMVVVFVVLVVARLAYGNWSLTDLVVLGVLAAGFPFFEWFAHAAVLHSRPHTVGGRTFYLGVARNHRDHHLDPENPSKELPDTARNLIYLGAAVAIPTVIVLRDAGPRLTVGVFAITALLTYEWTHYIVHTSYRPQGRLLQVLRRRHRLHHYHDERRWYAIAGFGADTILRTGGRPASVPRSPTCRNLGIELPT